MKKIFNKIIEKKYLSIYRNFFCRKTIISSDCFIKLFKLVNNPAFNNLRESFINDFLESKLFSDFKHIEYGITKYHDNCLNRNDLRIYICDFIINYHEKLNDLCIMRLCFHKSIGDELIYYLSSKDDDSLKIYKILKDIIVRNFKTDDYEMRKYIEKILYDNDELPNIIKLEDLYNEPLILLNVLNKFSADDINKIPYKTKLTLLNYSLLIHNFEPKNKYDCIENCFKYIKFNINANFITNYLSLIKKLDIKRNNCVLDIFIKNQKIDIAYANIFIKEFGINIFASNWNTDLLSDIKYLIKYAKENNLELSIDTLMKNDKFKNTIVDNLSDPDIGKLAIM